MKIIPEIDADSYADLSTGRRSNNFNSQPTNDRQIIHYPDTQFVECGREYFCYENSFHWITARNDTTQYIEGFLFDIERNLMIHHAWGVDQSQRLNYKVTPINHREFLYFGYPVDYFDIKRHWTPNRTRNSFFSLEELTPIAHHIRGRYPDAWIPPIPRLADFCKTPEGFRW